MVGMIDALTTNHTAFLREPDHFEFLRQEVLPALASREIVEIWSAACSTGEEVWTLACLLNDAGVGRQSQIVASDISMRALRFAERGITRSTVAADCLERGSRGTSSRSTGLRPAIGSRLRYGPMRHFAALISWSRWCGPRRFPAIFCRNVMIYFDAATQERVVRQLSECLEPGGYLFVGHAESLTRISHSLDYVQPAVYRKPAEGRRRWGTT